MKSVQLESLGFLSFRHALNFGTYEQVYRTPYGKYLTFLKHNDRDLTQLKHHSFKDENFDQIENFVEYDTCFKRSYYNRIAAMLHKLTDLGKQAGD